MEKPVVTLIEPGNKIEFRGKRSYEKRNITVNKVWEVTLSGQVIGYVFYRLVGREQRTPGRRYVNSRWDSPAYLTSATRNGWQHESYGGKQYGIDRLHRDFLSKMEEEESPAGLHKAVK